MQQTVWPPRMVIHIFQTMISAPARYITPPRPRTTYIGNLAADGVGESVHKEALGIDFAPHQAFHDAGDPHRGRVKNDADCREPEVPVDRAHRIHAVAAPQSWCQEVERAKGDHAVPAKRAGVHVTNGPVGVVAKRVHRADRHHRTLECGHAVEGQRDHHHPDDRIGAQLVPCALQRHQTVDHAAPAGHPQDDREHHAQGRRPIGQRGVVQVVRTRPDIQEDQRPEVDDRQLVAEDRTSGLLGHEVVHHAKETGSQEEAHRVVAVPPLRHRILHTREDLNRLGAPDRHRDRQVVDHMQHRDGDDERQKNQLAT